MVGDAHLFDDALPFEEHGEDVLEHALITGRVRAVLIERKKKLFARGEQLGPVSLVFFATFFDLTGPAAEQDAFGFKRRRLIAEHVAPLDVAAERLVDDARHKVADM